jgi:chromosome segregation ATPase
MSRPKVERRLSDVAKRLTQLRDDLRVAEEQHRHFADDAEDARLRAIVSENPMAKRDHRAAQRHAEASDRHRADLVAEIARLERTQDELLDRLLETMED